ncbi:MAG: FAD-binding protein, partial [candidate division WOR-3 bacterium]
EGRAFLISESLRGEGAILRTKDGRTFMERYHPDASLAPRDVVARAIAAELARRNDEFVLLDATHLPPERLRSRFPNIYQTCRSFGIDITIEPIPVVPAAHYVCGGIAVNSWSETSIPRLFAAGECACTGLHGANRLASNSLLEALVFADRAAERAQEVVRKAAPHPPSAFRLPHSAFHIPPSDLRRRLRQLMWEKAGIVRSDAGLGTAAEEIAELASACPPSISAEAVELRNLLVVARLVVACALRRKESRGLHYNIDHPEPSDEFEKDTIVTRQELEAGPAQPRD